MKRLTEKIVKINKIHFDNKLNYIQFDISVNTNEKMCQKQIALNGIEKENH